MQINSFYLKYKSTHNQHYWKICVKWEKFFIFRIKHRGSGTNPMCTLCAHIKVEGLSKHFPSPIGRMIYVRGHYCYTIAMANGYETAFMCHASSKPYYSKTSLFACIVIPPCSTFLKFWTFVWSEQAVPWNCQKYCILLVQFEMLCSYYVKFRTFSLTPIFRRVKFSKLRNWKSHTSLEGSEVI